MTWLDFVADAAFGPEFKHKFDFTLEFEHAILTIGPAAFLLLAVPILLLRFRRHPTVISPGWLLWLKLVSLELRMLPVCTDLGIFIDLCNCTCGH